MREMKTGGQGRSGVVLSGSGSEEGATTCELWKDLLPLGANGLDEGQGRSRERKSAGSGGGRKADEAWGVCRLGGAPTSCGNQVAGLGRDRAGLEMGNRDASRCAPSGYEDLWVWEAGRRWPRARGWDGVPRGRGTQRRRNRRLSATWSLQR